MKENKTATEIMIEQLASDREVHLKWLVRTFEPFTRATSHGSELQVDKLILWLSDTYNKSEDRYCGGNPELREKVVYHLRQLATIFRNYPRVL